MKVAVRAAARRGAAVRAAAAGEAAIGIIGGSGLYELEGMSDVRWRRVRTPFGDPSDEFCEGRLDGRRVVFLPRHGRGHRPGSGGALFHGNTPGVAGYIGQWGVASPRV